MSAGDPVADEVRALVALDLEGLRAEWRRRYGAAPALRSHDLLRRNLAWRIQAAAYGGADADLRRRLTQRTEPGAGTPIGARLARELVRADASGERPDLIPCSCNTNSLLAQRPGRSTSGPSRCGAWACCLVAV